MLNRAGEFCVRQFGIACRAVALTLGLSGLSLPAFGATGVEYLIGSANPDGSYGATPSSLATPYQATSEVLRVYQYLEQGASPVYGAGLGYLNSGTEANTEYLARKIIANGAGAAALPTLIADLLSRQDPLTGGFGNEAGYGSSVLDTAFALEALVLTGHKASAQALGAVSYLLSTQRGDGGWADGENTSSVYLTALAIRGLSAYWTSISGVAAALANAQSFLLSQRTTGGLWSEPFETALALLALHPIAERSLLTSSFTALAALQQANGSWVNDPYTTALALQALALLDAPAPDPSLGVIQGRVIDALTGAALAGVSVTLTGSASQSLASDSSGSFRFASLTAGTYSLTLSLAGYATITTQTRVNAGQTVDLGVIPLSKSTDATTGTVRGIVTDAQTGAPLGGVAIVVTGAPPAITDANGAYQIANVPPGSIAITAFKVGYNGASGSATVTAGSVVIFSPALSPQTGDVTLQGRIIESATGAPLAGVTVNLSGPVAQTLVTGADGLFSFTGLPGGSYTLTATTPGFFGLTASIMASPGQYDLGDLGLSTNEPATTGTLRGSVTDAQTGAAIAGATVSVGASQTATDADGSYAFADLAPGEVVVQVSSPNYVSASGVAEIVAGGTTIFSPALTPLSAQETALEGTVRDGASNAPLAGVTITLSGEAGGTATTNAQGYYRIGNLNPGVVIVTAALAGYDPVTATGTLVAGSTANFSPRLYASNTTPPDANATGVTGVVLDAGTGLPLAATITATAGNTTQTTTTDGIGRFQLTGFEGTAITLTISATDYVGASVALTLEPLKVTDIGQIRLRRAEAATLLPDLVVTAVDGSQVQTDPQTFAVTGLVTATIENRGSANATSAVEVIAFYDTNRNGQYDQNEPLFGTTTVSALNVGQSQTVSIALEGTAAFRAAPISVLADSDEIVVESIETNNVNTTASSCEVRPGIGTFQPVLKWEWTGSSVLPEYNQVMSAPVVAQTNDDNGDGKIDAGDIPDIIFIAYSGTGAKYYPGYTDFSPGGILRIVSGQDGHELVAVPDTAYRFIHQGNLAAADVDGDGLIEIFGERLGGGVIAFNHDGTFKWHVSLPQGNGGAPAIADIDHDGTPEIVFGTAVINADGTLRWGGQSGMSIVADIYNSGDPAIISGASAYSSAGQLLWRNDTVGGGFTAVGNFNADPSPEIVVVSNGRIFLLDHNGQIIWGPIATPGGGGGPPTVADMDGDGRPEIGVAGARSYSVFKADGSLLWSSPTQDLSSQITGSSVFDFEGDGQAEVVYADETYFRVYRGTDGAVLAQIPNSSGTVTELPIVADVDGDNHADIVVVANQFNQRIGAAPGPGNAGIRVFQDANNSWVNTRKIWNQHSYHITNVNDDGTVPAVEQPSWQVHNTYRLNAFPDRRGTGTPDLSAGGLVFGVTSSGATLTARIGNGGAETAPAGTIVRFYEGDPMAGGRALGSVTLAALRPGEYADATLSNIVSLAGNIALYAWVDPDNRVTECREGNNRIAIPGPQLRADLIVREVDATQTATDPQTLALAGVLGVTAANQGTLGAGAGVALLAFYDLDGDNAYQQGADTVVGHAVLAEPLPVGTSRAVQIPVSGTASFRDAPILVWIDSDRQVPESDEDNNVNSAASACAVSPSVGNFVTDPNDPRNWLGATVGTFAALYYGADTLANRQRVVDNQLLVDGIFDPTGAVPATLVSAGGNGGCLGTSLGRGFDYVCATGGDVSRYANAIDNLWFQTSGTIGQTVFDLGFDAQKVAVFNTIDHGPLPQEAIESTVYLSNDRIDWRLAVTERVWLEGYLPDQVYDGFVYVVGTGTGERFRYVSVIHGGPGALIRDGDNEINGLLGLRDDLTQPVADLTASLLRVMDQGSGQGITLSLRVGNAGSTPVATALVAFYDGEPGAGGTLLGTSTVGPIPAGGYRDVTVTTANLPSGANDLYAVVDSDNRISECREDNNVTRTPLQANVLGRIAVATDKTVYTANSPALLQGQVTNTGALAAGYTAELRVEDLQGALVAAFPVHQVGVLAGGATTTVTNIWNTGTTIAGSYRLRGQLRDQTGGLLSEAVSNFEIVHGEPNTPAVTLRTVTDRPVYHITDLVNIDSLIANVTANAMIENARLRIRIRDAAGNDVFSHEGALGQLPPGALRSLLLPYGLNGVAVGPYRVEGEVVDAGTGEVLASSSTQYQVISDPQKALTGQISLANGTVEIGTSQICTYTVTNRGTTSLSGIELRLTVVNLTTGQAVETVSQPVSLAPGGSQTVVRSVSTGSLTPGDYACALEALIDGASRSLAYAPFKLVEPPIRIDASMAIGNKGRLLVLLDGAKTCAHDEDDDDEDDEDEGDHEREKEQGSKSSPKTTSDDGHPESCAKDGDPHGPTGAPAPAAQRRALEQLLTRAGWSYTITDTAEAFARELRTGGYAAYALLSEHVKLKEQVQKELREAVFRGEGLVVAGSHDNRNHRLNDALGIKRIGSLVHADAVAFQPSPLGEQGSLTLLPGDRINRVQRTTAEALATYRLSGPSHSGHNDCRDEDHEHGHEHDGDECHGRPDTYIDAVTLNLYGYGKSLFAGFDLLAQATQDGSDSLAAKVLLASLEVTHPRPLKPALGGILPVKLVLENQGVATTAIVSTTIPAGATVVEGGGGTVTTGPAGQTISWTLDLEVDEEKTLVFYLRLPASEGSLLLQTAVGAAPGGVYRLITQAELLLTVEAIASLEDLLAQAQALAVAQPANAKALRAAAADIEKALNARTLEKAIEHVLEASDALLGLEDPAIVELRSQLGEWLRYTWMLMG